MANHAFIFAVVINNNIIEDNETERVTVYAKSHAEAWQKVLPEALKLCLTHDTIDAIMLLNVSI